MFSSNRKLVIGITLLGTVEEAGLLLRLPQPCLAYELGNIQLEWHLHKLPFAICCFALKKLSCSTSLEQSVVYHLLLPKLDFVRLFANQTLMTWWAINLEPVERHVFFSVHQCQCRTFFFLISQECTDLMTSWGWLPPQQWQMGLGKYGVFLRNVSNYTQ